MRTSSYKNFSRDYRILERMASQMTGVYFWDYSPFICPDGVCSPYYKGKLMYWEITHYNEIMARTVALDILANYNLPVPIELILKAATNSNF